MVTKTLTKTTAINKTNFSLTLPYSWDNPKTVFPHSLQSLSFLTLQTLYNYKLGLSQNTLTQIH